MNIFFFSLTCQLIKCISFLLSTVACPRLVRHWQTKSSGFTSCNLSTNRCWITIAITITKASTTYSYSSPTIWATNDSTNSFNRLCSYSITRHACVAGCKRDDYRPSQGVQVTSRRLPVPAHSTLVSTTTWEQGSVIPYAQCTCSSKQSGRAIKLRPWAPMSSPSPTGPPHAESPLLALHDGCSTHLYHRSVHHRLREPVSLYPSPSCSPSHAQPTSRCIIRSRCTPFTNSSTITTLVVWHLSAPRRRSSIVVCWQDEVSSCYDIIWTLVSPLWLYQAPK